MRFLWVLPVILALCTANADAQAAPEPARIAQQIDALDYQIDGCDSGDASLCASAGEALKAMEVGDTGVGDTATRVPAIDAQCTKGNPIACWVSGEMMLGHLVTDRSAAAQAARQAELARATARFRKSCDGEAGPGCLALAHSFWRGRGVPQDRAQTLARMQAACELGYAPGCTELAHVLTERFEGFVLDPARAARALMIACNLDDSFGCYRLAETIDETPDLGRDWHGTRPVPDLYEKACKASIAGACVRLAEHYYAGEGVPENDVLALRYFQRGCELGDSRACDEAAGKEMRGEGTQPDRESALAELDKACQTTLSACEEEADALVAASGDQETLLRALPLYERNCVEVTACPKAQDLLRRIIAAHHPAGESRPVLIREDQTGYDPAPAPHNPKEGASHLHFTVLPDGSITNCTAQGTTPALDAVACKNATRTMHFLPGTDSKGHPVAMETSFTIRWIMP